MPQGIFVGPRTLDLMREDRVATSGRVAGVAKRKLLKPIVAVVGLLGTMASIWWFALRPRRKLGE